MVIVLEDEPEIRVALVMLVESLGFTCRGFAAPGATDWGALGGVDHPTDQRDVDATPSSPNPDSFGCVLIDVRPPVLGGLRILESMREKNPLWPRIVLTDAADAITPVRAARLPAVDILTKPFSGQVLRERLLASCRRRVPKVHEKHPPRTVKLLFHGNLHEATPLKTT